MRYFLFTLFLFSGITLCSQTNLGTRYTSHMDSLVFHKIVYDFGYGVKNRDFVMVYRYNRFKLSFSTRVNTDILNDFDTYVCRVNGVSIDDYLVFLRYDIRIKFYLSRDIRLLFRVVMIDGVNNQYSIGLYKKF